MSYLVFILYIVFIIAIIYLSIKFISLAIKRFVLAISGVKENDQVIVRSLFY